MSGGFECDGDGRYELVRDGIAVLCNTTPLAVDAGNPNPSIFHLPSSIPYISYSAFVQPRHLSQPTGPPLSLPLLLLLAAPPSTFPTPSLRSASSAFARPDPRPAAALVFAWIWWWVGGGSLAGLCNWGGG